MNQNKKPSLLEASIVLGLIILSISVGVIGLHLSPNITILFAISVSIFYMIIRKMPLEMVNNGIVSGLKPGIIPTLMVVGFKIISVKWFVPSVFLVCAIVGSAVGSAFTVMSTIGIAFFGIGTTLGLNPALIVGAIVSGSVFGDKMSPLSESTNLASAIVGADLFKHIKHLMWSTVPAFIVSLILFAVLGLNNTNADLSEIDTVINVLESNFSISFWSLIPIALMLICAWKKIPAIITILLNVIVAVIMIIIQDPSVKIANIATVVESGFISETGNTQIDLLLSRGGISSMMPTVALIILTLSLGGILMEMGLITTVINSLVKRLNATWQLIVVTLLSSIGVNIFIGEQFLSVILPGNAFKEAFKEKNIDPVVLSRTLEDGGTVINYLIPWGIAGSFVASTFGVPTLVYLPFAFFSLLSPVFSIISAVTGIGVLYTEENK
jgi:NhaC family Na+:H+ antiporter